jgi:drug/metabolite transporter (DMT)-like permease
VDVILALVAAFLFALGLVLQEKAASSLPAEAVGKGSSSRSRGNRSGCSGSGRSSATGTSTPWPSSAPPRSGSSLVFGIVLFDEGLHETAAGYVLFALALAVSLAGLVILARAKGAEAPPAGPEPEPQPALA